MILGDKDLPNQIHAGSSPDLAGPSEHSFAQPSNNLLKQTIQSVLSKIAGKGSPQVGPITTVAIQPKDELPGSMVNGAVISPHEREAKATDVAIAPVGDTDISGPARASYSGRLRIMTDTEQQPIARFSSGDQRQDHSLPSGAALVFDQMPPHTSLIVSVTKGAESLVTEPIEIVRGPNKPLEMMFIVNDADFGDPRKVFDMSDTKTLADMDRSVAISADINRMRADLKHSVGVAQHADSEMNKVANIPGHLISSSGHQIG